MGFEGWPSWGLVPSPNQSTPGQSVRDTWDGKVGILGSGSDFTSFQDFAGIPSADMGFRNVASDPVYHYHSNYDSFAWMQRFGDKGFHYHITAAKIWAVLAAYLAEKPVIGFKLSDYAEALEKFVEDLDNLAKDLPDETLRGIRFLTLANAVEELKRKANVFDKVAYIVEEKVRKRIPWWRWWTRASLYRKVRHTNRRYKYFEREFLYERGLDRRSMFKHVVFAPGYWTGYAGATFPGIRESLEAGNRTNVEVSDDLD